MPAPKNFRLHDELRARFEKVCGENLFDERSVVEAWLLQFLEADQERRQMAAKRYADWLAERQNSKPQTEKSAHGKKKR